MRSLIDEAFINLGCREVRAKPDKPDSLHLEYRLPYIYAFSLCSAGLRQAWLDEFSQRMTACQLYIDTVSDAPNGDIVFTVSPIQKGV